MEIRIESMIKDHSDSWIRISHGLNKLVSNLNNNEQGNLRDAVRRQRRNVFLPVHHPTPYLLGKELGPKMNHKIMRPIGYPVSKKLINLLRHGSLPREDGSIGSWSIKDALLNHFCAFSTLV